jgi:leader peptidase (prepilin peptidase) / N-methyltransferase
MTSQGVHGKVPVLPTKPSPAALAVLLLAPIVGSFLGVLIRRLPAGRPVALARSACDACGARLSAWELIPVASYVLQRGRCRHCGSRIASFHVAVELAALAVAVVAIAAEPDPARLWIDCALGWTLLALAWIDWECLRLPDVLTLPLLLAGLAVTLLREPDDVADHAVAAIAAYLLLRGVALIYCRLRGREGLGAGDAKLLAASGAWLGLAALPWVLLCAAIAGLVAALGWALAGRRLDRTTALPFGPWLALAMWVLWLYRGLGDASI